MRLMHAGPAVGPEKREGELGEFNTSIQPTMAYDGQDQFKCSGLCTYGRYESRDNLLVFVQHE